MNTITAPPAETSSFAGDRQAEPRAATPPPAVVITWAERAECTCPDACDRDHEQD